MIGTLALEVVAQMILRYCIIQWLQELLPGGLVMDWLIEFGFSVLIWEKVKEDNICFIIKMTNFKAFH